MNPITDLALRVEQIEGTAQAGRSVLASQERHRSRLDFSCATAVQDPCAGLQSGRRGHCKMQVHRQDRRAVGNQQLRGKAVAVTHATCAAETHLPQVFAMTQVLEQRTVISRTRHESQKKYKIQMRFSPLVLHCCCMRTLIGTILALSLISGLAVASSKSSGQSKSKSHRSSPHKKSVHKSSSSRS